MADQTKLRKRLEALLKLPENQVCADCNKRGPRWASANLGIFFCIECSGIHRNLGVHISFVRSVNLDTWTEKQVQFMEEWGNARANAYYEANLPSHVLKPKEGDPVRTIERFIRDKYEHKRYVASSIPERGSSPVPSAAATTTPSNGSNKGAAASNASRNNRYVYEDEDVSNAPAARAEPAQAPAPQRRAEPAAAPAPVVAPKAAAPAVDLLNFDEPVAAPAPVAPTAAPAPAASVFGFATQPAAQPQFGGFDNFSSAPAAAPATGGFAGFDNFGAPADSLTNPVPAAAPAPAKPQASADSILSLFSAPQPAYGGGMQGMGMQGWNMQQNPQQAYYQQQQQGFYPQQQQMPQQMQYGGAPMGAPYGQQQYAQQPQFPQQAAFGQPAAYGQMGYGQQVPPQQPQPQQQAFANLNAQWR